MQTFIISDNKYGAPASTQHPRPHMGTNQSSTLLDNWDKFKHTKLIEDSQKLFPVGCWVCFANSKMTETRPWCYEVIGYNELWKECRWNVSDGQPEAMILQTVRHKNDEKTSNDRAWSTASRGFRRLTQDERRWCEAFFGKEEPQDPIPTRVGHELPSGESESPKVEQAVKPTLPYLTKGAILERQIARLKGACAGTRVTVRGTSQKGEIERIWEGPESIEWRHGNTQPVFIQVKLDTGVSKMYAFKQIKVY